MTKEERLNQEAPLMFDIIKCIYKRDLLPPNWVNRKKDLADLIERIEGNETKGENYDGRMKV